MLKATLAQKGTSEPMRELKGISTLKARTVKRALYRVKATGNGKT